jgi:hypothetical protein
VEKALLATIKFNKSSIFFYTGDNTFVDTSNFNFTANYRNNLIKKNVELRITDKKRVYDKISIHEFPCY